MFRTNDTTTSSWCQLDVFQGGYTFGKSLGKKRSLFLEKKGKKIEGHSEAAVAGVDLGIWGWRERKAYFSAAELNALVRRAEE